MLALSTSWQSGGSETAEEMLAAFNELCINEIELSYRISEPMFEQLRGPLQRSGINVVSVHNYFPIPSVLSGASGGGDLFRLSSPDKAEQKNAIAYTAKTIESASALGAAAVVLHCGLVEISPDLHKIYEYFHSNKLESKEAQMFIHHKLKQRGGCKPRHMDSLLASLDHLATIAEKQGVWLGLENRYHFHELPGPDDFRVIFDAFEGAPIGYWHDTGHAHANEILGFTSQSALLQDYADRLIGVHLHDAVGLNDHIPPGDGEIDFTLLKPCLKDETLKVIELKPGIPASDVSKGMRFVRDRLLKG